MKNDKIEALKGSNKDKQIISSDPVAQSILSDLYAALLKKKSTQDLETFEKEFIRTVEENYLQKRDNDEEKVKRLIEEAQSILDSTAWNKSHTELHSALEKIVFLGIGDKEFEGFFENFEKSVSSILQLDFSLKAPFTDINGNKKNLINYISAALNMIIEKLEASVVSRKSLNSILASYPYSIIIVTDEKGSIRFINDIGETMLNLDYSDIIGVHIGELINEYDKVGDHLKQDQSYFEVSFSKGQNDGQRYYLSTPKVVKHQSEVTELVYVISNTTGTGIGNPFDFSLDSEKMIVPLNLIIVKAHHLQKALTNEDHKVMLKKVYDSAWFLKEQTQGTLVSLAKNLPNEYEPVNFKELVDETITQSRPMQKHEVDFVLTIPKGVNFVSSPTMIGSLFKNLVSNSLKFMGGQTAPKIAIEVIDRKHKGVSIIVTDNGIGISREDQEKFFEKHDLDELPAKEKVTEFYMISQIAKVLEGNIDVKSKAGVGTTLRIDLSHPSS